MERMRIEKILVPIDFSLTSENALKAAIHIAEQHKAKLYLLHIIEPGILMFAQDGSLIFDITSDSIDKEHEHRLEKLYDRFKSKGYWEVESVVKHGEVTPLIVQTAEEIEADLLVMGSHGTETSLDDLLGTNAYSVVKRAKCPVLTIPTHYHWEGIHKVLFPIRSVLGALDKYPITEALLSPSDNPEWLLVGLNDQEKADDKAKVEEFVGQFTQFLTSQNKQFKLSNYEGENLAGKVLEMSNTEGVNLIVMTTSTTTSFAKYLAGSYSQQVVNHSRIPVLSVSPDISIKIKESEATPEEILENLGYGYPFSGTVL